MWWLQLFPLWFPCVVCVWQYLSRVCSRRTCSNDTSFCPWFCPGHTPPLCPVTVQLYLGRSAALAQKKPSAGSVSWSVPGRSASGPRHTLDSGRVRGPRQNAVSRPPAVRKPPSFSPPLRQSGSYSPLDTPSYCSPLKSPSQYFQICY